jgi:hypothetical protein
MEAISADGYYIPPFIIFGGKYILARWFNIYNELDYCNGVDAGWVTL